MSIRIVSIQSHLKKSDSLFIGEMKETFKGGTSGFQKDIANGCNVFFCNCDVAYPVFNRKFHLVTVIQWDVKVFKGPWSVVFSKRPSCVIDTNWFHVEDWRFLQPTVICKCNTSIISINMTWVIIKYLIHNNH